MEVESMVKIIFNSDTKFKHVDVPASKEVTSLPPVIYKLVGSTKRGIEDSEFKTIPLIYVNKSYLKISLHSDYSNYYSQ
jgi:hypothetical protein